MCTIINFIIINHKPPTTENLKKLWVTNLVMNNTCTPPFGHNPLEKVCGVFIWENMVLGTWESDYKIQFDTKKPSS
jgi:hypothetical protein